MISYTVPRTLPGARVRCSAFDDIDRDDVEGEAAAGGFFVFDTHVGAGFAHGFDGIVEGDVVLPVAEDRHSGGSDCFDGGDGVAFNARDLDKAADGVAGEPEVVFDTDLGGVFDVPGGSAEDFGEPGGCHRAGGADLSLAADFGAGDGGAFFEEDADRGGGEEEVDDAV